MRKILEIILLIILFLASTLIFWAGLAPVSFNKFFSLYPVVNKTIDKMEIFNDKGLDLSEVTTSEPVLSNKGQVHINNNYWNVEIAANDAARTAGLSNRKSLRVKNGLLFVFEKLDNHSFWMKDMLIPIDMVFFDDKWQIVLIESNLQPNSFPKVFGNKTKSQYVLEINALEADSYGLKVGDRAIFLNK